MSEVQDWFSDQSRINPVSPRCESFTAPGKGEGHQGLLQGKTSFKVSEDLDLVNKFNIVYTMAKEHISLTSFPNMCSGAS